jgi:hypothetical protein
LQISSVSDNFCTMFRLALMLCLLSVGLLPWSNATAQADPEAGDIGMLRQEIEKLHAGQRRMQQELEAIKGLLTKGRQRPLPSKIEPTVVDIRDNPFKGKEDARVTLVDFTDYQ